MGSLTCIHISNSILFFKTHWVFQLLSNHPKYSHTYLLHIFASLHGLRGEKWLRPMGCKQYNNYKNLVADWDYALFQLAFFNWNIPGQFICFKIQDNFKRLRFDAGRWQRVEWQKHIWLPWSSQAWMLLF